MVRLFTAIDLPESVTSALGRMAYGLPGARWVEEEQLHLTLRFIGEVDGGLFREIREELAEVQAEPFEIQLQGFGCFPPRGAPRVLWAGVHPATELARLKRKIDAALARLSIPPEARKFSPHVTVARLKNSPPQRVARFIAGNNLFQSPPFHVEGFHLYSSQLTPKGAIHRVEASYPLDGGCR